MRILIDYPHDCVDWVQGMDFKDIKIEHIRAPYRDMILYAQIAEVIDVEGKRALVLKNRDIGYNRRTGEYYETC